MDVRQAWQFPATQALLSLLSPSHSVPNTTPTTLEDALQTTGSPLLVQLHAKLLRLPASSQHKWRASIARYVTNHPQYFDEHVPRPPNDEAYESTTPHERLLLLHALAEAVLSEHPPEASVEQLRPYPIGADALRNQYWYFGDAQRIYREPGEVARKKAEEDARAAEQHRKAAEIDARRREREQKREAIGKKREEKRKRDAEKWAPRVAVGRSTRASSRLQQKTVQRTERDKLEEDEDSVEEKPDAVMDDWLLREIGITSDDEDDDEESPAKRKQQPKQEEPPRRSGRRRKPVQPPASPPAKRPRKKDLSPPPPPPPPPKRKEFADPELRACTHWETVSANADELRAFMERFGTREKLAPVERSLLKRFDEILPEMDEAEAREKRETDRKAKAQFLLMNQKRSTRVQAIYARREEEARREAEREEKEREEAARIAAHRRAVFDAISFLVRDQSRDIRGARREFGMDEAIDRDEVALRKQEKEKALRAAAAMPVRRSTRMQRAKHQFGDEAQPTAGADPLAQATAEAAADATAEAAADATADAPVEATADAPVEATADAPAHAAVEAAADPTVKAVAEAGPVAMTPSGVDNGSESQADKVLDVGGKGGPGEPRPSNGKEVEPGKEEATGAMPKEDHTEPSSHVEEESKANDLEDRGTTIDSTDETTKSSPEGERSLEHERKRQRFSSATHEDNISQAFTWSTNDEDKLPMRVLDKFFFASSSNFADAPLEDCEVPKSDMVGFGLLIPPTTAPPDVERVEISRVLEWMFEYGGLPKIWIKSDYAWYELREPAVEYQKMFVSARRKFEICARVAIMGDTMRGAQLNYSSILDYLSYPYGEMLAYQDSDVLTEKRYIVSQIELLNKRSLLHSGFIRELQKRIRAEDRKAAQERAKLETHEAALEMKREEEFANMREEDMVVVTRMNAKLKRENQLPIADPVSGIKQTVASKSKQPDSKKSPKEKSVMKRLPRKRSGKPVPRAVSSIVNGLLRAATKSCKTPRKRKAKSETGAKGGSISSPKRTLKTGTGNHGLKTNGTVGAEHKDQAIANGYDGVPQARSYSASNGGTASTAVPEAHTKAGQTSGSQASGAVVVSESSLHASPGVRKDSRRMHPLFPRMVGHGMSPFVGLPRQQVLVGDREFHRLGAHVGVNGFRRKDSCKKE